MTKTIGLAIAVLLMVSAVLFSIPVFSGEAKLSNLKDFKSLEGGRWEALNHKINAPDGVRLYDYSVDISKITTDGIAVGTYTSKWKQDEKPTAAEINSKIETTPDMLPRLTLKSISSPISIWMDLQPDGSFKLFNGAILKRVK